MATKGWDKCSNTCQFCRWWSARFCRGGNKNTKYTKTYENWIISKLRMGVCHMSQIDWDLLINLNISTYLFYPSKNFVSQTNLMIDQYVSPKKTPSWRALILRLQKSPFLPWFHLANHEEMYIPLPFAFFFLDYIFSDTYFQKVNNHNQNTWFSNIRIHGMCVSCCVLKKSF